LKKSHPCGGDVFEVVREGPEVTLRCAGCGSFVRMAREKYQKSTVSRQASAGRVQEPG
jgi:hypothetical protein